MIPRYRGELQFFFLAGPFLRLGQGIRSLTETKIYCEKKYFKTQDKEIY